MAMRTVADAGSRTRVGSWEWDVAADRVSWSDDLFRLYGYAPQAFVPSSESLRAHVQPADTRPFDDVRRVQRADATEFVMRTQGEVVCGPDGTVVRVLGVCEDVTDRLRAEEAERRLAAIVRNSHDAIYTIAGGIVTSWNPAARRLFGYTEAEAVGASAGFLTPAAMAEEDERLMARALAERPVESWRTIRTRRDGSHVSVSVALSPIRDAGGRIGAVSVMARDVSERRDFEEQLRYLTDHDPLTGLPNRRCFEEELDRAVQHSMRYGTGGAVFVLDLDNFRLVNDALGHGLGDELIRAVARLLRSRLRSTDVLARLGGDELAVLIAQADARKARAVARGLVAAVRGSETTVGERRLHVTTSLGGILLDDAGGSGTTALARADLALYAAKDAGRDRAIVFGAEEAERATASTGWDRHIEDALRTGGFELYLQPILDLQPVLDPRDDVAVRYEALLRMNRDRVVLPGEFLPAAERSGLIHEIDRWVLREAIALIAAHPDIELEVNLSARSLDDEDLISVIARELRARGADPTRLIIEITETATIANMQDARRLAEALGGLGCRFAIDDFGAGFGSFSYLKHLPAAFLKIDGDFVRAPRSRTDQLVIEAIVGMAKGLGKQTIAEFVGDEETIEMLRATGVDFAQGFHVGRPFPAACLASPDCVEAQLDGQRLQREQRQDAA